MKNFTKINRALVAKKKLFLFIAAALMSAGMAQSAISDYPVQKNIDYVGDSHTGHKMDIYYPNDEQTKHPVVIHIYGSAWASNSSKGSADLSTVGIAALEAGYVFVAPNHRMYSDALFPAQLQDIKALVRYLRANAETLKLDTSFIAVSGFSSGGHLAVLMGVTRGLTEKTVGSETINIEGNLGNYTDQSSSVDAVCSWAGMVELRSDKICDIAYMNMISLVAENLIGPSYASKPDLWALACADTYVDAKNAPTVLFHGSADNVYPQCESKNFYDKLQAANVESEYYPHTGGHGVEASYLDEMITFLNKIKAAKAAATALDQTSQEPKANCQKLIEDGQLLILRDGKVYTVTGAEVR